MTKETQTTDIIGGFPYDDPNCKGCGKPLTLYNAWLTDGCPCNSPLGINSMNETRWRLLMQLQQQQSFELADARKNAKCIHEWYYSSTNRRICKKCGLDQIERKSWEEYCVR